MGDIVSFINFLASLILENISPYFEAFDLINKSDGKKCLNFLLKKSEIILRSFLHSRYSYCKGYDAGYAKAMEQNRPAQPKSLWDDICGVTVSMFSSLFNFKR